jgi:hypothetical protein
VSGRTLRLTARNLTVTESGPAGRRKALKDHSMPKIGEHLYLESTTIGGFTCVPPEAAAATVTALIQASFGIQVRRAC